MVQDRDSELRFDVEIGSLLVQKHAERFRHTSVAVAVHLLHPHVHNLGFLRTRAQRLDRRLTCVWPMDTRKDRAMFEKLKVPK